jgi:uncharacterized OsmC-like protein
MNDGKDEATLRTLRCRTIAEGNLRQASYIRDLPVQQVGEMDLTGQGSVPNGLETLLAAFGSCLVAGIHANALAWGIRLQRLEVALEADVYTTSHWGTSDIDPHPVGFEAIRASVSIVADTSRAELERLVRHATLWSPVGNTLFNPVALDVSLAADANAVSDGPDATSRLHI